MENPKNTAQSSISRQAEIERLRDPANRELVISLAKQSVDEGTLFNPLQLTNALGITSEPKGPSGRTRSEIGSDIQAVETQYGMDQAKNLGAAALGIGAGGLSVYAIYKMLQAAGAKGRRNPGQSGNTLQRLIDRVDGKEMQLPDDDVDELAKQGASPVNWPWYVAGGITIPAGLLLAKSTIDKMFKTPRADDKRLEKLKAQYHQLLSRQSLGKQGSAADQDPVVLELDQWLTQRADAMQKQSGWLTNATSQLGMGYGNLMLALALTSALGTGALTHHYMRKSDPARIRSKAAIEAYKRFRANQPPQVIATIVDPGEEDDLDELDSAYANMIPIARRAKKAASCAKRYYTGQQMLVRSFEKHAANHGITLEDMAVTWRNMNDLQKQAVFLNWMYAQNPDMVKQANLALTPDGGRALQGTPTEVMQQLQGLVRQGGGGELPSFDTPQDPNAVQRATGWLAENMPGGWVPGIPYLNPFKVLDNGVDGATNLLRSQDQLNQINQYIANLPAEQQQLIAPLIQKLNAGGQLTQEDVNTLKQNGMSQMFGDFGGKVMGALQNMHPAQWGAMGLGALPLIFGNSGWMRGLGGATMLAGAFGPQLHNYLSQNSPWYSENISPHVNAFFGGQQNNTQPTAAAAAAAEATGQARPTGGAPQGQPTIADPGTQTTRTFGDPVSSQDYQSWKKNKTLGPTPAMAEFKRQKHAITPSTAGGSNVPGT